jgi:hypothetical protein
MQRAVSLNLNLDLTYKDNTVYYWRVAPVVGTGRFDWNTSSFIFMSGHASGFNQSHKFQHSI